MTTETADPSHVLDQWRSRLADLRKVMVQAGVARPEQVAPLTGLQQLQAMLQGKLPYPPIADTLDFWLVEVEFGRAVFQGTPLLRHYNPLGSVHGGWFATLLDSWRSSQPHLDPARFARVGAAERDPGLVHHEPLARDAVGLERVAHRERALLREFGVLGGVTAFIVIARDEHHLAGIGTRRVGDSRQLGGADAREARRVEMRLR